MIDLDSYFFLCDRKGTLSSTSKDDSDSSNIQYMTSSTLEVVDFDLVKKDYVNSFRLSEDAAKSVDAILQTENGIVFIEFKNGKVANNEIKNKARDSLLIFLDIIGESITFSRGNIDYVVVYNPEKNLSKMRILKHVSSKANIEPVFFGLDVYGRLYFRNVHTYSKEEFEEYLRLTFSA